jgi:hypothetical protein
VAASAAGAGASGGGSTVMTGAAAGCFFCGITGAGPLSLAGAARAVRHLCLGTEVQAASLAGYARTGCNLK